MSKSEISKTELLHWRHQLHFIIVPFQTVKYEGASKAVHVEKYLHMCLHTLTLNLFFSILNENTR